MNSIPSIFNQHKIPYIVLCGNENAKKGPVPVTCVLLSRNGRPFRERVLKNVLEKGFEKIISVNPPSEKQCTVSFSAEFPSVKFIVTQEEVSQGELLNLAFSVAETKYVLVLQEELCFEKIQFTQTAASRLMQKKIFCIAPRLFSSGATKIPVTFFPSAEKSVFKIESEFSFSDGRKTLYPFDYSAFYDREKFILLGGIDYTISSEYWQKIDFFFRSWLWGEKTLLSTGFDFFYTENFPEENRTVDISYLRFYLKNLIPVFSSDHGKINALSFLPFKARSECGFLESFRQFRDASRWVKKNQYRFKTDAVSLIENWRG